jgi:hypothetical protein
MSTNSQSIVETTILEKDKVTATTLCFVSISSTTIKKKMLEYLASLPQAQPTT